MKILLIEDEKILAGSILDYLQKEGYICEIAYNYRAASEKANLYEYDIILADITLPDGSGFDIIKQLKTKITNTGIIIISAKNSIEDKIEGLDLGADDYIGKPFHLAELNARVKAVVRRKQFEGMQEIVCGEININTASFEVRISRQLIQLTKKEYDLLLYFISNKNRVITKESIAEHLWGDNIDAADSFNFIYTHVKNLRKKMAQANGKDYIKTIYGLGYKFEVL
jgi:DNA-binding response OmpR family regulator